MTQRALSGAVPQDALVSSHIGRQSLQKTFNSDANYYTVEELFTHSIFITASLIQIMRRQGLIYVSAKEGAYGGPGGQRYSNTPSQLCVKIFDPSIRRRRRPTRPSHQIKSKKARGQLQKLTDSLQGQPSLAFLILKHT